MAINNEAKYIEENAPSTPPKVITNVNVQNKNDASIVKEEELHGRHHGDCDEEEELKKSSKRKANQC